ncbi:MAG: PilZ domain-containing protein [Deltaproteobacteria bacterium]|nr:PilZ domain-containing protein [Deltaproteobacteria bacterium]
MKDKDKEKDTVLKAAEAKPEDAGRREYVRTSDHIPVYYEQWSESAQQKSELDWEVLFNEIEPSPEENPRLYELLFDINQKLNMLIRHMSDKNGFNMPEARDVNISGGGLRFFCSDFFKEGEKLILKTFLPTFAHAIKIRCEVVRSIPAGAGGYEVAVKYVNMDEGTREKIIKYIFAKQRKLLRHDKADEQA